MKPELIVALDLPSADDAAAAVARLPPILHWYKVGLELFMADGPVVFNRLMAPGRSLFLDLKLHDIPNTVAAAVRAATRHGASMLTVHAHGGRDMLRAAADAAAEAGPAAPLLLAVTTLTSLSPRDLDDFGVARSVADHTAALSELAVAAGIHGLVCSVHEAAALRVRFGTTVKLVTPGIRPAGTARQDQQRIATPAAAIAAGADFLVVGRPILGAPDPVAAASAILAEMETAWVRRQGAEGRP